MTLAETLSTPDTSARTLVIDSATGACSVALFEDDSLIEGTYRLLGRGHAEALVPMIAALPERGRASRIAVALGPGSFTGVRVGIAAARALALAWGARLVGYPSLALVAAMDREAYGPAPVAVVMTGGHGEWFVESFDEHGHSIAPLASLRPEAALAHVALARIAGNEAQAFVARRGHGCAHPLLPDARAFAHLPSSCLRDDISPLYGRAPDARAPGTPATPPAGLPETPAAC